MFDSSWLYVANGGRVGVWLLDAPAMVLDDVGGDTALMCGVGG